MPPTINIEAQPCPLIWGTPLGIAADPTGQVIITDQGQAIGPEQGS